MDHFFHFQPKFPKISSELLYHRLRSVKPELGLHCSYVSHMNYTRLILANARIKCILISIYGGQRLTFILTTRTTVTVSKIYLCITLIMLFTALSFAHTVIKLAKVSIV